MKTPIEALIQNIEKSPNEILTKTNVLHALKNMLPTEREHLEAMTDACSNTFKHIGVRGFTGKEVFERRYKGIINKTGLI